MNTPSPHTSSRSTLAVMPLTFAIDVVLIIAFAILGRRSHELGQDFPGIISTASPFLIAFVIACVATRFWKTPHLIWHAGILVWVITVAGGLALRVLLFDETAALSFQAVTAGVLGAFLLGRRLLSGLLVRRVHRQS